MKLFFIISLFLNTIMFSQNSKLFSLVENVKTSMLKRYYLEKQSVADINGDNKKDAILVFSSIEPDKEIEVLDSPVIMLLSSPKGYIRRENHNVLYSFIPSNANIDDNLVVKNNFFTMNKPTGNGNNKETKYITFKISNNQIYLHKYSIVVSFPKNGKIEKKL